MKEGFYEFPAGLNISAEAIHFISKCLQYSEDERAAVFEIADDYYIHDFKIHEDTITLSTSTGSGSSPIKAKDRSQKVVLNSKS